MKWTASPEVYADGQKVQTVRRDSGSGRFITKRQAERRDPRTWETQHIKKSKSHNHAQRSTLNMLYLISYDLMKPGKDYKDLWAALYAIGAKRILESEWLVRHTNTTPVDLANYCLILL